MASGRSHRTLNKPRQSSRHVRIVLKSSSLHLGLGSLLHKKESVPDSGDGIGFGDSEQGRTRRRVEAWRLPYLWHKAEKGRMQGVACTY